jgi:hypothetical protein
MQVALARILAPNSIGITALVADASVYSPVRCYGGIRPVAHRSREQPASEQPTGAGLTRPSAELFFLSWPTS